MIFPRRLFERGAHRIAKSTLPVRDLLHQNCLPLSPTCKLPSLGRTHYRSFRRCARGNAAGFVLLRRVLRRDTGGLITAWCSLFRYPTQRGLDRSVVFPRSTSTFNTLAHWLSYLATPIIGSSGGVHTASPCVSEQAPPTAAEWKIMRERRFPRAC